MTNTPTCEGCWPQSYSVHLDNEDQEAPWLQNPTAYKHSNFFKKKDELGQIASGHNMHE